MGNRLSQSAKLKQQEVKLNKDIIDSKDTKDIKNTKEGYSQNDDQNNGKIIMKKVKGHNIQQVKKQQQYESNKKIDSKAVQAKTDSKKDQKTLPTEQQMLQFVRAFELKNLTFYQISQLYKNYYAEPQFRNTFKSSLVLISFPAFTNLYYLFRPNGILAPIMPFLMPIVCLAQYIYFFNHDLQNFCFNEKFKQEAEQLRKKYQILYMYQIDSQKISNLIDDFKRYEKKENNDKSSQEKLQSAVLKEKISDQVL